MPANATESPRAQAVHRLAQELGFTLVAIAPAEPTQYTQHVRDWIGAGKHGDMAYLKDQLEDRLDPRKLVPGARSVICVAEEYTQNENGHLAPRLAAHGRIARYALDDDYHRTLKKRLHNMADGLRVRWPDHEYRTTVDTAPILEREHAARAGLGWVGKNTLLINSAVGSYFFLGEIVTTLAIQPSDAGATSRSGGGGCGTCTRCIDACPTHCITPYSVDASRCVSYLTLEHRGPIAPELHEAMGDWIAGCDVCQEVCPFNEDEGSRRKAEGGQTGFSTSYTPPLSTPRPHSLPLLDILHWDAPARQRAFERSALKRLKLDQLKRNALIAAGNALAHLDDAALRTRIEQIANDPTEPELVRTTANQVLTHLNHPQARP